MPTDHARYQEYVGQSLAKILKEGHAWDKIPTTIPGIFLILLPDDKYGLEFLPIDQYGKAKMKRGIICQTLDRVQEYRRLFTDPRVDVLMQKIEVFRRKIPETLDLGEKHEKQTTETDPESDTETDTELSG